MVLKERIPLTFASTTALAAVLHCGVECAEHKVYYKMCTCIVTI